MSMDHCDEEKKRKEKEGGEARGLSPIIRKKIFKVNNIHNNVLENWIRQSA